MYYRQAGGPIVGGFVLLRVGVYTAQLTPDVRAAAGRAFSAGEMKHAASQLAARWKKTDRARTGRAPAGSAGAQARSLRSRPDRRA